MNGTPTEEEKRAFGNFVDKTLAEVRAPRETTPEDSVNTIESFRGNLLQGITAKDARSMGMKIEDDIPERARLFHSGAATKVSPDDTDPSKVHVTISFENPRWVISA